MAKKDIRAEVKEIDLKDELKDYSGPFKPDLRYSDFSKEQLVKMYLGAGEYFLDTVLAFVTHIVEKYGMDAVDEAQRDVWLNKMGASWYRYMNEVMGIKGNDIESLMKAMQAQIDWGPADFNVTFEMPSKDRGVVTLHRCRGVDMIEPLEQQEILEGFCALDNEILISWAKLFNPDIVTTCLAKPPRKRKDDICCKWEFTYKSE